MNQFGRFLFRPQIQYAEFLCSGVFVVGCGVSMDKLESCMKMPPQDNTQSAARLAGQSQ
jgi:hypothetical protein